MGRREAEDNEGRATKHTTGRGGEGGGGGETNGGALDMPTCCTITLPLHYRKMTPIQFQVVPFQSGDAMGEGSTGSSRG